MYMKVRKLLLLGLLCIAGTAAADDYGYFTVRQSDGQTTTFTAIGLKMTFNDGKLVATQNGQTTELSLANLSAMYFSDNSTTAIDGVNTTVNDCVTVYTLGGIRVAEGTLTQLRLPQGIYIVDNNGQRTKMLVK